MAGKVIVVIVFLGILASLGSALIYMVKDKGRSDRTVRALTVRISLSVGLFLLLFVLYGLGLIEPHGLRP
jgi:small neutral amino acid transporter SnatA (MarC family)